MTIGNLRDVIEDLDDDTEIGYSVEGGFVNPFCRDYACSVWYDAKQEVLIIEV